jgi:hypothetical protein
MYGMEGWFANLDDSRYLMKEANQELHSWSVPE